MALSECANESLSTLKKETLSELRTVISNAKNSIDDIRTEKNNVIDNIDIALASLTDRADAISTSIDEAKASTKIVPPTLAAGCPDLGKMNIAFETSILGKLEAQDNIIFEVNRLKAVRIAVVAEISQLDSTTDYLDDLDKVVVDVMATK